SPGESAFYQNTRRPETQRDGESKREPALEVGMNRTEGPRGKADEAQNDAFDAAAKGGCPGNTTIAERFYPRARHDENPAEMEVVGKRCPRRMGAPVQTKDGRNRDVRVSVAGVRRRTPHRVLPVPQADLRLGLLRHDWDRLRLRSRDPERAVGRERV